MDGAVKSLMDIAYGDAPLAGERQTLHANIHLPEAPKGPVPMFIWFHGGAFNGGSYVHFQHRKLARHMNQAGIALATPQYRLKAEEADLSAPVRDRLDALAALRDPGFEDHLCGPAALAALEDAVQFANWIEARRGEFGFDGRLVLGGSAAGAITAFNLAFLAPYLGFGRPEPGGCLSYSGGFAYPSLYRPGAMPVFALHNPADPAIGIASIRGLARADENLCLVEAMDQHHGTIKLDESEHRRSVYGRIWRLVWQMSGLERPRAEAAGGT